MLFKRSMKRRIFPNYQIFQRYLTVLRKYRLLPPVHFSSQTAREWAQKTNPKILLQTPKHPRKEVVQQRRNHPVTLYPVEVNLDMILDLDRLRRAALAAELDLTLEEESINTSGGTALCFCRSTKWNCILCGSKCCDFCTEEEEAEKGSNRRCHICLEYLRSRR